MSIHNQHCSRCNKSIHCQANNIMACECTKIEISEDTVDHLKNTKFKCLCNECLVEVDKLVQLAYTLPTRPTEGLHYVMENGLLVFTELNHIQRGYCCGSNCRNCAYGFRLT